METGLVKVDARALLNDIERSGHASIYGVHFDTGKTDVKPESRQAPPCSAAKACFWRA
ncbi:hypothetical protein EDC39_103129 [Geothermobacter ehrlichii]|uniref:Uncharacterized protein n=1 Tax=Geothermobacter ehrlichii TaxID=213224 RepID=A0A5D3WJY7_9BACT|nr:hypothetical protein [Geothermobacter ehrlichii]TYO99285.1 hypothetical protein EDC39_103129 [Geothermobacter ehrlichii]